MVVDDPVPTADDRIVCDVRTLACPLSLLRVKQTVHELSPGSVVTVLCADAWTALDVEVWAQRHHLHVHHCTPARSVVHIRLPARSAIHRGVRETSPERVSMPERRSHSGATWMAAPTAAALGRARHTSPSSRRM